MPTTMWEVRAAENMLDALVAWVTEHAGPDAQIYRSSSGEPRVVVIDPSGRAKQMLADPPAELVARPAHAWNFEQVRNG